MPVRARAATRRLGARCDGMMRCTGAACLTRLPEPPARHAGPPAGAYDAQDFAKAHAKELGMKTVPSLNVVFTEEKG